MGQHGASQSELFYSFNLEAHVPPDHLLRRIDRVLDLGELRRHLAPFYSNTGRPSVDPELMIRMLVIGYCFGIRSERRFCEEVHLNLAYRWFCRLGLQTPVPDHSTFYKNRHGRFRASGAFRWLFDDVVRRCMASGLVAGEGFAIDASVVAADANRQRGVPSSGTIDWGDRAVATRAVREYLEALDGPSASPEAKNVSLTDPQARWTAAPGGPAFYAYSTNYLVDTQHAVIIDLEATPAYKSAEVDATKTMIERTEARFGLVPRRLIGDMAYGTAPMLAWLVEDKGIEPHVPVWDKTQRSDDTLSSAAFAWNESAGEYRCPQGYPLRREWRTFSVARTHVTREATVIYRSRKADCASCGMKDRCCPNTPIRRSLAACTKPRATSPGRSAEPSNTSSPGASEGAALSRSRAVPVGPETRCPTTPLQDVPDVSRGIRAGRQYYAPETSRPNDRL